MQLTAVLRFLISMLFLLACFVVNSRIITLVLLIVSFLLMPGKKKDSFIEKFLKLNINECVLALVIITYGLVFILKSKLSDLFCNVFIGTFFIISFIFKQTSKLRRKIAPELVHGGGDFNIKFCNKKSKN